MISPRQVSLAHMLHIEYLADVKQTVSVLEQETRQSPRLPGHICSFVVVRDTFEAFEIIAHKRFDCIIIDENVEFSAYEAVQTMRRLMPDIPILMILHSRTMAELNIALKESEAVGCTHILASNFTYEEYCTALQHMLSMQKKRFHALHEVTHFPWEKSTLSNHTGPNFHYLPPSQNTDGGCFTHYPPLCPRSHPATPLPPPLPASLMQHPSMSSDLLVNAMQFFNAQRSAHQQFSQQFQQQHQQLQQSMRPEPVLQGSGDKAENICNSETEEYDKCFSNDTTIQVDNVNMDSFNEAMLIVNACDTNTTV